MDADFLEQLALAITQIKNKTVAKNFLMNILTPSELDEIPRRLQIVKELKKGMSQREVAAKLGVSIGTVSRGARELKYGVAGFQKILK